VNKEELIQFWKSIVSRSVSRNFLKDSSMLRDMTFFYNFGSYLCKNWLDLREKFIIDVFLGEDVAVKFWK